MGDQGDTYGQGIKNAQETVGVVQSVVNLFGGFLSSRRQKRKARQEVLDRLGEWASEAYNGRGQRLRPVLRAKAFKSHLTKHAGRFYPSGHCTSSLAWAHLLYALEIRPGGGVLDWKLPIKAAPLKDFDQDSLELDGEVLCYIINLYRLYSESAPSDIGLYEVESSCKMPFGEIYLQNQSSKVVVSFAPGTLKELSIPRRTFTTADSVLHGDKLPFKDSEAISKHEAAIENGCSENNIYLTDPTEPLNKRVVALLRCLYLLTAEDWRNTLPRGLKKPAESLDVQPQMHTTIQASAKT